MQLEDETGRDLTDEEPLAADVEPELEDFESGLGDEIFDSVTYIIPFSSLFLLLDMSVVCVLMTWITLAEAQSLLFFCLCRNHFACLNCSQLGTSSIRTGSSMG